MYKYVRNLISSNKQDLAALRDNNTDRKLQESRAFLLDAVAETHMVVDNLLDELHRGLPTNGKQVKIEHLAHSLQDALMILSEDGIIQTFNKAAEKIFGWDSRAIIGKHVSTFMSNGSGVINLPVDADMEVNSKLTEHVKCFHPKIVDVKRKNGEMFKIEITMSKIQLVSRETNFIAIVREVASTGGVVGKFKIIK